MKKDVKKRDRTKKDEQGRKKTRKDEIGRKRTKNRKKGEKGHAGVESAVRESVGLIFIKGDR